MVSRLDFILIERIMTMLKVGIAGFGFMGRTHYRCWKSIEDIEIDAICDLNPELQHKTLISGNIEKADEAIDISGLRLYNDFEKMLSDEKLDAVSITLPTYLHADYSIKALSAGVNVLCEKPMALNVEDCMRMIAAAEHSGKLLQIGQCVRFWPEYAAAKEIVNSGRYGKVVAAFFRRLSAAPAWSAGNWITEEKLSGGMALDLHIHDTDFVQYLLGMPDAVCSFGVKSPDGGLKHIFTQYLYDDEKMVAAEGSWAMSPTFGFCPVEGREYTPEVQAGDGWLLQTVHFAKALSGQNIETVTTPVQSMNSVKIVNAEKKSAELMEKVKIE
jgi:predicted dehydrogenase